MKMRRRRSTFPRFDWRRSIDNSEPLKGQLWTRSEKTLQEPDVHWARRAAAGAVALFEAALLLWLLLGPATAIRNVEVHGANHMTAAQVMKAAGLDQSGSILAVDPAAEQQRLLGQTWIRTASVQPMLNGTVRIDISEWQPVAVYHSGASGSLFLMSDQAVLLGLAPNAGLLVNIQGPGSRDPKVGDRPLDPQLLVALVASLLGILSPVTIPISYARYTAISLLAALDSIFGAFKAYIAGSFEARVFFSGLVTNMALAAGLTFFGDKLGVDLSIAAIVAFGVRIFNNLGAIRRHYL